MLPSSAPYHTARGASLYDLYRSRFPPDVGFEHDMVVGRESG